MESNKLRVLFLTDNFPPEVNAPANRTFEHCCEWVSNGVEVTVITCAPNFPKGKVFAGYRNALWQVETMRGIRVVRVWTYITSNEGFFKRILDYVSFMFSASIAALLVGKIDLIIGTSPQFFTVCAAWVAATLKRKPWIFELRDIWPESIKVVGMMKESMAIRMVERIEMFLYRQSSSIVTVTHSFKEKLISRGIDSNKIGIVTNGVDLKSFVPQEKDTELLEKLGLKDCFVAGYIGTHGIAHGLETLLSAAEQLQKMNETSNIRFLFLGDGSQKAELLASSRMSRLQNVLFLDSVPREDVARYWSLLDISIIHLRKTELFKSVIPSKLFECMSMGIPVLHGVSGESADIVRTKDVGEVFEPENVSQLVEALLRIKQDQESLNRYRQNGPIAARHYDRTFLAKEMLKILKHVKVAAQNQNITL
ncbi:colanic acid biosynthesis glycosyl transferase WcaI [Gammaproteobacteria bacterium]